MIRPDLTDIINDYKTLGQWKIHLAMAIHFISSKDSDETCTMHPRSDNIEVLIGNETDKIMDELFETLLQRYEKGLEESMKGSKFVFDNIDILY